MLASTILVSPITETSAATSTHFEESWPSHPVFTPTPSVATAATMMTPIPIDAGTIDLRQNASAEYGLASTFSGRRRWSGMTIATFFPCRSFMLHWFYAPPRGEAQAARDRIPSRQAETMLRRAAKSKSLCLLAQ